MPRTVRIALVPGDGSGPEMMSQAVLIADIAAKLDGINLDFVHTPAGWDAYGTYGDTLPKESFDLATEIGILFFGGVGDPKFDDTIGEKNPKMKPEARCLLAIRKRWGLLLNFRPMIYYPQLKHLSKLRPDLIPDDMIVKQIFIRFLLEDSYFGNDDLMQYIPDDVKKELGIKLKGDVTGDEEIVTDMAYYRRATLEKYLRAAFKYAVDTNLPVISVDKSNVMPRQQFWRKNAVRIGEEFPDVELRHRYSDATNMLLFNPRALHGVVIIGNEHGDVISDGGSEAVGSLGMMCSSAINPDNNMAMFESGAGTVPQLAGQNKANPIGRILTAAMMLRHIGALKGAKAIEEAVTKTLANGYRTADIASSADDPNMILGTKEMGKKILSYLLVKA